MNQPHDISFSPDRTAPAIQECNSRTQVGFRHYFIVMNPRSGSANIKRLETYARQKADELGKRVEFHLLEKDDDLPQILRDAAARGAEVFVAAGGDGTLAAVATEALHTGKVFGVIPSGTANVFAAEHLIPKKIEDSIDLLFQDAALQPVDVVMVHDKAFLCHISVGTYSWITTTTPQKAKRIFGRIAYIWNTIRVMLHEKIWTFELNVDGRKMVRRASTIMVTNAGSMGATGLRWGENISTADGLLEICIIRARTFRHYLALFWAFLTRKRHHPLKEYVHVRNYASVRGPQHLPIRADGEEIGHGHFEFRVAQHGLKVLMPAAAAAAMS